MQKSFSFKGIVRNTDNLLAREGECMELVNMRVNNGSLQPVAPPNVITELPAEYTAIYIHSIVTVYFCITPNDARVHLYDRNFKPLSTAMMINGKPLLSLDAVGVQRVEFIGNIVCMFTANKCLYAIYDGGKYKWLGAAPQIPSLRFDTTSIVHEITTDKEYRAASLNESDKPETRWVNCSKGYFDEALSKLNTQGYFVDRALFRFAFRLFDGSYICASPIYYVEDKNEINGLYRDRGNFYSQPVSSTSGEGANKYIVRVQGFKPEFIFSNLNLEAWENIIVSLDVFTSGSILGHKVLNSSEIITSRNENVYYSSSVGYERYSFKPYSELWREVAECSLFYKIAEYKLDGSLSDYETDVSQMALSQCITLPLDCGNMRMMSAAYSYVFNGRLHIASLRETHFSGYSGDCYLPASLNSVAVAAKVYTELKTEKGSVVVKKVYNNNFLLGESSGDYCLTPLLLYPDARARSMTFVIFLNSKYYRKTFKLTQHRALDFSYYLNYKIDNLHLSFDVSGSSATGVRVLSRDKVYSFFNYTAGEYTLVYSSVNGWMYGDKCFAAPGTATEDSDNPIMYWRGEVKDGDITIVKITQGRSDDPIGALCDIFVDSTWEILDSEPIMEEKNTTEERPNVMRVSAVDNPFSFPLAQTYKPSDKTIYAVCSNTVALSQGQFGQHPLYLFCADGIWAMSVDTSGSVAYSGSYPLSREVCNNPLSVRGIDSGVVFTTDKGLMLIQGGTIRNLSAAILSEPEAMNNVVSCAIFNKISAIVSLDNIFTADTFANYASGALLGYNYQRREIIVTNNKFAYSYVFSIESGEWYKISHTFDFIGNSYPYLLGLSAKDGVTRLYRIYDKEETETPVLLFSRPLLWGGKLYKRVMQMMLHAAIEPAKGNNLFNGLACYLLCSNDGVNYKLVTGSEIREEHNDIHFPYIPSVSHRYFMIALVGNLSTISKITAVEMYVESAWNNRIR